MSVSLYVDCPSCAQAVVIDFTGAEVKSLPPVKGGDPVIPNATVAKVVLVAKTYRKSGEVDRAEGIEQALSMLGLLGPTVGAEGKKIRREIDLLTTKKEHELVAPKKAAPPERSKALDRVLQAAFWAGSGAAPVTLAILSGYSPTSSSFVATIAALVDTGWLVRAGNGLSIGRTFSPRESLVIPGEGALFEVITRKLGPTASGVLRVVLDEERIHGRNTSKETAAEISGYSLTSSTFNAAFTELAAKGYIQGRKFFSPTPGLIAALDVAKNAPR